MRINPLLALLILLGIIFYPSIESWAIEGDGHWYRPFLVWLLIIALFGWHNHYQPLRIIRLPTDDEPPSGDDRRS